MKTLVLFSFFSLAALEATAFSASTIDPAIAFAWGADIGWTNWRPSTADGVVIGENVCSGLVYCANVGWVNMGGGAPTDGIRYGNAAANDFGVNVLASNTPGFAVLRGFAYGANIGWINFEQTGNPVLDLSNGRLSGYAWSANCGWINLGTGTPHGVATGTIAPGAETDHDGITDSFEYENFGDLATADPTSDFDGDGASDLAESIAGTDPLNPSDALHVADFTLTRNGTTDLVTLTFPSETNRLYRIEQRADFAPAGVGWMDSGLGAFFADGPMTSRNVETPAGPRHFYRVVAQPPLTP